MEPLTTYIHLNFIQSHRGKQNFINHHYIHTLPLFVTNYKWKNSSGLACILRRVSLHHNFDIHPDLYYVVIHPNKVSLKFCEGLISLDHIIAHNLNWPSKCAIVFFIFVPILCSNASRWSSTYFFNSAISSSKCFRCSICYWPS